MRPANASARRVFVRRRCVVLVCGLILVVMPASLVRATSIPTFSYESAVNARVGAGPISPAVADLNGDGKADLVVANSNDSSVSVLLGKGDGTFTLAPGSPITVGLDPVALVLADLNNDGKKDLVVASDTGNSVSVLLSNGDGTFTAASGSPFPFASPSAVAVGDLNGDGKLDLVVTNSSGNSVSVLRGNGDGTFTAFGAAIAVGSSPVAMALGDLNGDGHLDLAVANNGDDTISVLLGSGTGAFVPAPTPTISLTTNPYALAIGDLNGDGHPDIVAVTSYPRGKLFVFLGNGNGTFITPGPASPLFSFTPYTSVIIVNVDGDTKPDLLVTGTNGFGVLEVMRGNGDGTFTDTTLNVGANPNGIAVGDFNGDGKLDFLVANTDDNAIGVYFGNGLGTFTRASPAPLLNTGYPIYSVVTADFNRDGKMDLATTDGSSELTILLGDGHGGFTPAPGSPIAVNNTIAATGDFNNDGKADLVVLKRGGDISVLLGNGDGTFQSPVTTSAPSGTNWYALAVGDLNGDGKTDVAVSDWTHNTVTPLISTGTGAFTVGAPIPVGATPESVAIGDLNGDGKGDIVVTNFGGNTVTVLLRTGSSFTEAAGSPIAVGNGPEQVVIADLNNDGKKDLVIANFNDDTISVLLGSGTGAFTAAPGSPVANVGGNNGILAVGDLNGDGIPDIAVPDNVQDGYTYLLTGNGSGGFSTTARTIGGANSRAIALTDVNGDGKRDIITVSVDISVLLNTTTAQPNPQPSPHPTAPPVAPVAPLPTPHPTRSPPTPPNGATPTPTPLPQPARHP